MTKDGSYKRKACIKFPMSDKNNELHGFGKSVGGNLRTKPRTWWNLMEGSDLALCRLRRVFLVEEMSEVKEQGQGIRHQSGFGVAHNRINSS